MSVLAPPPQDDLELELLIREARARQRRRRLIGAAVVAVLAAAGLSLWAAIPGLGGGQTGSGGGPQGTSPRAIDNAGRVPIVKVGTSGGVTWAINGVGMWLTANGGRTWRASAPRAVERQGDLIASVAQVAFSDREHGWLYAVLSRGGGFYSTSDGGRTWQSASPSGCCGNFSFVNRRLGFFFGSKGLYETRDGGTTWTLTPGSSPGGTPLFLDARHGATFLDGGLLWTADTGRHWKDVVVAGQPTAAGNKSAVGAVGLADGRLVLVAEHDFAAKMYPGRWRTLLYFSDDGGAHWTQRAFPSAWHPSVGSNGETLFSAATANDWFAAARNELAATTDAGRAWKIVHVTDVPKRWVIGTIDFTSARVGWAIFNGPKQSVLMRTTDAGRHWTPAGPKAPRHTKH